jgi:hypothetical protein
MQVSNDALDFVLFGGRELGHTPTFIFRENKDLFPITKWLLDSAIKILNLFAITSDFVIA